MALNVLHVVSNTGAPHTDEASVRTRLEGRGDTVTYAANNSSPPTPGTYDVVVIGRTSLDAGVEAAWRATTDPIVAMRDISWPGLFMATNATGSSTDINVSDAAHPIAVAAGLSAGANAIYSGGDARGQGTSPGAGIDAIAYGESAAHHVLFAYETSAALTTGNAAARRIGWGMFTASLYTSLGQAVLFACCDYAAGVLDGGGPNIPAAMDFYRRLRS